MLCSVAVVGNTSACNKISAYTNIEGVLMAQTDRSKAKQRAGLILSGFLRSIAEEKTEVNDSVDDPQMISKAEALARLIWKKGLGWTEKVTAGDGIQTEVSYHPDRVYVGMLLDRLEGRVAAVEAGGKEKRTVADKVGEQSKKRINKIAGDSVK